MYGRHAIGDTLLINARVIDGLGGAIEGAEILVSEGRIASVTSDGALRVRPGSEVLDLAGKTLMPALVDAHVHLSSYETLPPLLRGEEPRTPHLRYFELANIARDLVSMGVLTVRDVGSEGGHALHLRQAVRHEVRAVVEEAHRLGYMVAAHAEGLEGSRLAIEEGVDTIEHGLSLHREPALLENMAENGQTLVPTFSTFHDVSEGHAEKYPCVLVDQAHRQREEAYATLAAAKTAGVKIAMGFDSYPLGQNARELVRMIDGGLTSMEGMVAATSGAADALGLHDAGRIEPGAVADLLVLDGDPITDPSILLDPANIHLVLQAGVRTVGARPGCQLGGGGA